LVTAVAVDSIVADCNLEGRRLVELGHSRVAIVGIRPTAVVDSYMQRVGLRSKGIRVVCTATVEHTRLESTAIESIIAEGRNQAIVGRLAAGCEGYP
jgi:hypothetical protein